MVNRQRCPGRIKQLTKAETTSADKQFSLGSGTVQFPENLFLVIDNFAAPPDATCANIRP
jgi:hypothetical protein